jgi:hypothetical protein
MREADFKAETKRAEKLSKLTAHNESVKIIKDEYVAELAAKDGEK